MRPRLERIVRPIARQKKLEARILYLSIENDVLKRHNDRLAEALVRCGERAGRNRADVRRLQAERDAAR